MRNITYIQESEMKSVIPKFVANGLDNSNLTSRMYRWFVAASDEAFKSDFPSAKIGCVIVYKNHIIGRGFNQLKTDPKQKRYNQLYREWTNSLEFSNTSGHTIHAEISALKSVPYPIMIRTDWSKVEVYIYRIGIGLDNYTGLSLPCPACANALSDLGIRHVYYTKSHKSQ